MGTEQNEKKKKKKKKKKMKRKKGSHYNVTGKKNSRIRGSALTIKTASDFERLVGRQIRWQKISLIICFLCETIDARASRLAVPYRLASTQGSARAFHVLLSELSLLVLRVISPCRN